MRNSFSEYGQADAALAGVGGRQSNERIHSQGGGYQDNCTTFECLDEAKLLAGLEKIGAAPLIIGLARQIGVLPALAAWRHLAAQRTEDGQLYVPSISTLERGLFRHEVKRLRGEGMNPHQIKSALAHAGINMSKHTIGRVDRDEHADVSYLFERIQSPG